MCRVHNDIRVPDSGSISRAMARAVDLSAVCVQAPCRPPFGFYADLVQELSSGRHEDEHVVQNCGVTVRDHLNRQCNTVSRDWWLVDSILSLINIRG